MHVAEVVTRHGRRRLPRHVSRWYRAKSAETYGSGRRKPVKMSG